MEIFIERKGICLTVADGLLSFHSDKELAVGMGLIFRQCAFFCAFVYVGQGITVHIDIVIGEEGRIRIIIRDYIVVSLKCEEIGVIFDYVYVCIILADDILRLIENDGAVISAANCYFAAHHVLRDKAVHAAFKIKVSVYFAVSDYYAACFDGDIAVDFLIKERSVFDVDEKIIHNDLLSILVDKLHFSEDL